MSDEKKIIIDEDWKSQVQAEKAAAKKSKPADTAAAAGQPGEADMPLPSATFELLLTTLATEALVALGQVPHPATGEAHVHSSQAQYLIDMIDVLRVKTKGNLSSEEQELIDSLLHQLRMLFIAASAHSSSAR